MHIHTHTNTHKLRRFRCICRPTPMFKKFCEQIYRRYLNMCVCDGIHLSIHTYMHLCICMYVCVYFRQCIILTYNSKRVSLTIYNIHSAHACAQAATCVYLSVCMRVHLHLFLTYIYIRICIMCMKELLQEGQECAY